MREYRPVIASSRSNVPKAKGVAVTIQDGKTVALTRRKALADEAKLFPALIVKITKPIIFRKILIKINIPYKYSKDFNIRYAKK
ncbi:hypothetical protein A1C_03475 [Rickettsia akari str. Hartford]|uniref:Uncharacterized protein n=1 Tax=Rickettsia akari (strain Hartford) TaxID=293614 RepID=A8GNK4_RICAH|nr:hypothetical protein [Rickettsia akari]ABV74979.1 hypothetical protein A1C_03475 [Rickettsia akari str. Hartford]